jgi:PAS domain S-box-containing protein
MTHPVSTDPAAPQPAQPPVPPKRQLDWGLLLLLIAALMVVFVGGSVYLQRLDATARAEAASKLTAVTELKIRELDQWRKERMQDAHYIRRTPYAARRALNALAEPASGEMKHAFTSWLDAVLANGEYSRALLLDTNLNVRLSHPTEISGPLPEPLRRAAETAMRTKQITEADLHLAGDGGQVQMSLVVPLVVRREGNRDNVPAAGTGEKPTDRSAGVLVLNIDPQTFLWPLIQTWPTPSPTSETMLVRREGDQVVYLNELRHHKGAPLALRKSINRTDAPAAMAARGHIGTVEGLDYRGVAVLAAMRGVPDTPWYMVAKVDQDEVYAAYHRHARLVWGGMALFTVASVLGVALLGRRRHVRSLRRQLQAEREKWALAERVELLMRNANDIILLTDERWRILDANTRAVECYGYSREELLGLTLRDLRAPAARLDFDREVQSLTVGGYATFETLHLRKDGTTFPVECSDKVVNIGGDRYGVAFVRDITERKTREREIERLNRLYATLSEINQAIVRVKSREELYTEVCRAAVEFGGFKAAWLGDEDPRTGRFRPLASAGEPRDLVEKLEQVPEHAPNGRCLCGTAFRKRVPAVANRLTRDSQTEPWVNEIADAGLNSAAVFPVRLGGKDWGVFAVYASEPDVFQDREMATLTEATGDITFGLESLEREARREQAEAALRESEEKHRLLVQTAREAIFVVRGDAIQFANGAAARLAGLDEAGLTGRSLLDFVPPEDRTLVRDDLARIISGEVSEIQKEYRAIGPRGDKLWLSVNSVRMSWSGEPAVLCLAADITHQRHLEAQFRQAQKMEAVGQLAGGVAHDFNNLLAVIRGNAELLLMDRKDQSSQAHECLSHIAGAAERAASLTRQLLIFSRKQVIQSQSVALNELINNLTKMLKRVIREDIRLQTAYEQPLPCVEADPGMLEQVLLNLVVNARDAMPQGGQLDITTAKAVFDSGNLPASSPEARPGEFVCLSVRDAGCGIAPDILPRIFEPFFTTKDPAKGTGLGLATVYGIVKQHQGWVDVTSTVGEGSSFRIYLPAIPAPAKAPEASPSGAGLRGGGEAILLVEDDYSVRMITRRVLESFKYKVHEAASAREALEVWGQQAHEITLLLTDIVMPEGMTGRDLAERLRAERADLKIIFMSGYSAEVIGQDTQFFHRTRSLFLQKPCPADLLLRTVRQCLDEK